MLLVIPGLLEPQPLHPCHSGGPGGPGSGPPCPPTPTPISDPPDDDAQISPGSGSVRFLVRNRSGENVTLWLGVPVAYVLNVSGESEMDFTVGRNVYPYELAACDRISTGYLNLTIQSFIDIEACDEPTLVAVKLLNGSNADLAVQLHGPVDYVIPIPAGQSRPVTIARGDYEAVITGCSQTYSFDVSAHAGRTIEFACP